MIISWGHLLEFPQENPKIVAASLFLHTWEIDNNNDCNPGENRDCGYNPEFEFEVFIAVSSSGYIDINIIIVSVSGQFKGPQSSTFQGVPIKP